MRTYGRCISRWGCRAALRPSAPAALPENRRLAIGAARPAFTLLEVLLVLALLAAVAAMAAPALRNTLEAQRLRSAGEELRAQFAKTRVRAMEAGRTFTFRYQPSGSNFLITAWSSDEDLIESSALTVNGVPLDPSSQTQNAAPGDPLSNQGETRQLPEGIFFGAGEAAADMRGQLLTEQQINEGAIDTQWSSPIFFYPDGTASTSRLSLVNQRQQMLTVAMRGLTGVIEISDLQVAEEQP